MRQQDRYQILSSGTSEFMTRIQQHHYICIIWDKHLQYLQDTNLRSSLVSISIGLGLE